MQPLSEELLLDSSVAVARPFPATRFLAEAGSLSIMTEMTEAGVSGGAIFDALVADAAREHDLDEEFVLSTPAEGRGSVFTGHFPVARVVPGSAVRATA